MNGPPTPVFALAKTLLPEPDLPLGEARIVLIAFLALILAGFFSVLRSALLHSVPKRVLEGASGPAERDALAPHLARAESLATSAAAFAITAEIVFVVLVLVRVGGEMLDLTAMGITLLLSVPLLVFAGEILPAALRGERSDALLRRTLPTFVVLQTPLAALVFLLDATRRAMMRIFRIPEKPASARQIVEDLRDVIEDSERQRGLQPSEREIIENVVDIHDVDVAEVMTPRTELVAVSVDDDLQAVAKRIADTWMTRVPVFEGNLDTIIGVVTARDIVHLVAQDGIDHTPLRQLVRPVPFVPETKLVLELVAEFRRDGQKVAIVLDEYGGTAGLITMGDVLEELFGDLPNEIGAKPVQEFREVEAGIFDVLASVHVSEVNEELDLELPEEEDYETLAGFVLASLGHLPKPGEAFSRDGAHFNVLEASDRRIFRVRISLEKAPAALG